MVCARREGGAEAERWKKSLMTTCCFPGVAFPLTCLSTTTTTMHPHTDTPTPPAPPPQPSYSPSTDVLAAWPIEKATPQTHRHDDLPSSYFDRVTTATSIPPPRCVLPRPPPLPTRYVHITHASSLPCPKKKCATPSLPTSHPPSSSSPPSANPTDTQAPSSPPPWPGAAALAVELAPQACT